MKNKEWTFMIYLNGTNELGLEMEKTFNDIIKKEVSEDINIVIQIGKAPIKLINMVRQNELSYQDNWSAVRRYSVVNNTLRFHEELPELNMADYKSMYNFIEWGMHEFPAERYFLSVSGHGFLAAALTEFCLDKPYTMGIYELCKSINDISGHIDILFLDVCNMNTIEFIYELGKKTDNPVKYFLTYINNAPLSGFNYDIILENLNHNDNEEILNAIAEKSEDNIAAVKINHGKLKKIKSMSNQLAYMRLVLDNFKQDYREDVNYVDLYYKIEELIKKMVVASRFDEENKSMLHFLYYNQYGIEAIEEFTRFYYKLSFTKNNYCSNVIGNKSLIEKPNMIRSVTEQEELDFRDIESIVGLYNKKNEEEIRELVKKIYEYRDWK